MKIDPLAVLCIVITLVAYCLSRTAYASRPSPFTTPVFFSTSLIIVVLLTAGLKFEDYSGAREVMTALLGPATVALAIPLYKNRRILLDHAIAALAALAMGSVSTIVTVIVMGKLFQLSPFILSSLSVKSVTVAIAVELASIVQGNPSLAAGFVIATGMMGAMLGPPIMDLMGIRHPVARGLSLGTIAHGQGTAQAALEGELQGALAGIAMGVSALFTSLAAPSIVRMLV